MSAIVTEKSFQNKLFINGDFVDAKSGKTFPTINPATEEKIADVASADAEDVDTAVKTARARMEAGVRWEKRKTGGRGQGLLRVSGMASSPPAEERLVWRGRN